MTASSTVVACSKAPSSEAGACDTDRLVGIQAAGRPAPKPDGLSFLSPSFLCITIFENKRLAGEFGSGKKYQNVAPHARSPRVFPIPSRRLHAFISTRSTLGLLRSKHPALFRPESLFSAPPGPRANLCGLREMPQERNSNQTL